MHMKLSQRILCLVMAALMVIGTFAIGLFSLR